MFNLLYIIPLLFILSCSSSKNSSEFSTERELIGVDDQVEEVESASSPQISEGFGVGEMGPTYEGDLTSATVKQSRDPIVGVYFQPALYRSLAYISFLKALERESVNIHMICGSEFGAVVGALYANGQKPDEIEWDFYKFFRQVSDTKAYTKAWFNELNKQFLNKFSGKSIQALNKSFCLPIYNQKSKKVEAQSRGSLKEALLKQFGKNNRRAVPDFRGKSCPKQLFKKMGVDIIIYVSAIGESAQLEKPNEAIIGPYTRLMGESTRNCSERPLFVNLPGDLIKLDQSENFSLILKKSLETSLDSSKIILEEIEKWKKDH